MHHCQSQIYSDWLNHGVLRYLSDVSWEFALDQCVNGNFAMH